MRTLLLAAVAVLAASLAAAQEPAPRMPDGHPDLSGVWWPGSDLRVQPLNPAPAAAGRGGGGAPPPRRERFEDRYNDAARARAKMLGDKDDPALRCMSTAFGTLSVSLYNTGFVGQIVQTPKFVVMMSETNPSFRIVPTDGRPHREDQPPSSRGDSVGHWDGDTFVVDTTNYSETNWMHAEGEVSFHSDVMHVVERYHRLNRDTMEVEATIEDPKVLTKSWTVPKQTLRLAPFDQIMALDCTGVESAALMEAAAKQNYGKK